MAAAAREHKELVEFAGKIKAPIVHALRGKEHVEYDNPYDVGMTRVNRILVRFPYHDERRHVSATQYQFPYRAFCTQPMPKIIQIDINPASMALTARWIWHWSAISNQPCVHCCHWWKKSQSQKFLDKALEDYRDARKGLDDFS